MWTLSDVFILAESRRYGPRLDLAVPVEHVVLYVNPHFAVGIGTLQEHTTFWNSVLSYLKLHLVVQWSWW